MRSYYKTWFTAFALTLALLLCIPAVAQGPSNLTVQDQTPNVPHRNQRLRLTMISGTSISLPTFGLRE